MKIDKLFIEKFEAAAKDLKNVFDEKDLRVLLNCDLNQTFYRSINKLEELGLIKRFCHRIFVAKNFKLTDVSQKIKEEAYFSFEYALVKHGMIGTYSDRLLRTVISNGRAKIIKSEDNIIEQFKINQDLYFGFTKVDGHNVATPEKAYLDCLYFHLRGTRFAFSIFSDIDTSLLNKKLLKKYLAKYKNPKFIAFVKGVIEND